MNGGHSKEFLDWSSRWGGPFDVDNVDDGIREALETVRRRFTSDTDELSRLSHALIDRPLILEWDFLANPGQGARAADVGDKSFIGIDYGLCLTIITCSRALFRSQAFHAGVLDGDTEGEQYAVIADTKEVLGNAALNPEPAGEDRKRLAYVVSTLAIYFILHHEFAHIWQGHSVLVRAQREANDQIEIVRAFEWRADTMSVAAVPRFLLQEQSRLKSELWQLAIAIAFYLSLRCTASSTEIEKGAVSDRAHPSLKLRLSRGLDVVIASIIETLKLDHMLVKTRVICAVLDVEKCFAAIKNEPELDLLSKDWLEYKSRFAREIEATWVRIRDATRSSMRGVVMAGDDGPSIDQIEETYAKLYKSGYRDSQGRPLPSRNT